MAGPRLSICLPLAGAVALAAVPAAAGPRGRVVRVERGPSAGVPRLCSISAGRGEGVCFGQPRKGERIAVLDMSERKMSGELVIEAVGEPTELTSRGVCVNTGLQTVKGTFAGEADGLGHLMGLRGARIDPRIARVRVDLPPPSGRDDETVELGVDLDGNGRTDLVITHYACDDSGAPASDGEGRCFDTYMDRGAGLRRAQQDIFRICR
jgi:hypothetical protein